MRSALAPLELLEPRTLDDALTMMRAHDGLVPLAGCTDVYVALNAGSLPATRFLNLARLESLRRIEMREGMLSIGAMATYTDVIRSPLVAERLPILTAAAREIGGAQIQNRGTVAGNVANGSPAGDALPVLAVAEAVVVLRSTAEERRVALGHYYTGYRASVKRADELIVAIEIPPLEGRQWFRKVGTRAAQAISKIVMAGIRAERPRIALGSVAPTVIRLPRTEQALASGASIDTAKHVLRSEIHPIDDVRSTAAYRCQVSQNLLGRFWSDTEHDT